MSARAVRIGYFVSAFVASCSIVACSGGTAKARFSLAVNEVMIAPVFDRQSVHSRLTFFNGSDSDYCLDFTQGKDAIDVTFSNAARSSVIGIRPEKVCVAPRSDEIVEIDFGKHVQDEIRGFELLMARGDRVSTTVGVDTIQTSTAKPEAILATSVSQPIAPTPAPSQRSQTASSLLVANRMPVLPAGEAGNVAVVGLGKSADRGVLPVVVRNNTGRSIRRIHLSGIVRGSGGALLASGQDQGVQPRVVLAGDFAFGYVYFGASLSVPPEATFEVKVTSEPGVSDDYFLGLRVVEFNHVERRLVGVVKNELRRPVKGPISVDAICFDEADAPLSTHSDYADADELPADGTTGFQIDLSNDACSTFMVAASGYSS